MDCIFCRIAAGEIPAKIVYEDDICLAFHDLNPQAPQHLLVIPREHFASIAAAEPRHQATLGHLLLTCAKIAAQENFLENGFRVVSNSGADAQQSVFHLHIHLLGGRKMQWNPA